MRCLLWARRDEATVGRLQQTGEVADAVIDALEKMEVTEAMYQAWCNAPVADMDNDNHGRVDATAEWRAMVGAMRDE